VLGLLPAILQESLSVYLGKTTVILNVGAVQTALVLLAQDKPETLERTAWMAACSPAGPVPRMMTSYAFVVMDHLRCCPLLL